MSTTYDMLDDERAAMERADAGFNLPPDDDYALVHYGWGCSDNDELAEILGRVAIGLDGRRYICVGHGEAIVRRDRPMSPGDLFSAHRAVTDRCAHLADSATPDPGMETDPCKVCGRYYVDE